MSKRIIIDLRTKAEKLRDAKTDLRLEYEEQSNKSYMNPVWNDTHFTDEYTIWLENRIVNFKQPVTNKPINMKNALKIVISLIIIAVLALLFSCGPEHLDDRPYEQVIIDPSNTDHYLYSYRDGAQLGWPERANVQAGEDWLYFFVANSSDVTLTSSGKMMEVRYYPVGNQPGYLNLAIDNNEVFKENVTPNGTFRIYYTF